MTVSGSFAVRTARPGDARALRDLKRSVAAEGRWIRTENVTRTLRMFRALARASWTEDAALLVAEDGGRIVGAIEFRRETQPAVRHVASFGMEVAADRRGQGIGAALLREGLRWAEGVGVRKVELAVYPDNTAARSLYERFGFVEEGRLLRHSRKKEGFLDEVLMGLWLGEDG